jgi:hypothetical protein
MGRALAAVLVAMAGACGGDDTEAPPPGPPGPGGCVPGELNVDGACVAPGIDPDDCAEGFEPDGAGGCAAVLPASCPPGQMAVPGDAACHEVAACGAAPWGDVPVDGATVYVDAMYPGADSDGTAQKPWVRIQDAVDAAPPGALVAIAAGTYAADVVLQGKALRLWGRCPGMVTVAGTGAEIAAVLVQDGAGGTILRGLAVTGAADGVLVTGSLDVTLEELWVHDTGGRGIDVEAAFGPTRAVVRHALVEGTGLIAIYAGGAELAVEAAHVRTPAAQGVAGEVAPWGAPAVVTLTGSLIEGATGVGIHLVGSQGTVARTVVRDTRVDRAGYGGHGLDARFQLVRPALTVRDTVVERSVGTGAIVSGGDLTLERAVLRDTAAYADGSFGRGLSVQIDASADQRAVATVVHTVVAQNREVGVVLAGADAVIESVLVRDTIERPTDGELGVGIAVIEPLDLVAPADASLRGVVVERCSDAGIDITAATARLDSVAVRDVRARPDGSFGDGIFVEYLGPSTARADITASLVERAARAGIGVFGATAAVSSTTVSCNGFDLDGEAYAGADYAFEDGGGNVCGCGEPVVCKVLSSGLSAPEPLAP